VGTLARTKAATSVFEDGLVSPVTVQERTTAGERVVAPCHRRRCSVSTVNPSRTLRQAQQHCREAEKAVAIDSVLVPWWVPIL
jgi:hypothetical protein